MPAFEIFSKGRRSQRRPLPPVLKRTTLVIFLKPAFEFGFFILKVLFPYKTPFSSLFIYLFILFYYGVGARGAEKLKHRFHKK